MASETHRCSSIAHEAEEQRYVFAQHDSVLLVQVELCNDFLADTSGEAVAIDGEEAEQITLQRRKRSCVLLRMRSVGKTRTAPHVVPCPDHSCCPESKFGICAPQYAIRADAADFSSLGEHRNIQASAGTDSQSPTGAHHSPLQAAAS